MDDFSVPEWIFANSIFANSLAEKDSLQIYSYSSRKRNPSTDCIFKSFGCNNHLVVRLSSQQYRLHRRIFFSLLRKINTTEDLFALKLDDIYVGVDIYESILRRGKPTVKINDITTWQVIFDAIVYYLYFNHLFKSGDVKYLLLSHDCYFHLGMVMRIAQSCSIPVYFANPKSITRSVSSYDLYHKFQNYPEYFRRLSESDSIKFVREAKTDLDKKLNGLVSLNMPWQTKSAFLGTNIERQLSRSSKIKVIVLTHCFYDNPHAYKKMHYKDFYEWMQFLGEISNLTDYDWYIKPHRDYNPGTIRILKGFVRKFPRFKLVNVNTSFHQLKNEGLDFALTCYGSAGHELPLLGINVINASYGPHVAYNFNLNPTSHDEYKNILMNLEDYLEFSSTVDYDQIFEFYALHFYITNSDSLLFASFKDYCQFINSDSTSLKGYEYFNLDPLSNHQRYRNVVDKYLNSRFRYHFESILS